MKASNVVAAIRKFGINAGAFTEGTTELDGEITITQHVHVQVPTFGRGVMIVSRNGDDFYFTERMTIAQMLIALVGSLEATKDWPALRDDADEAPYNVLVSMPEHGSVVVSVMGSDHATAKQAAIKIVATCPELAQFRFKGEYTVMAQQAWGVKLPGHTEPMLHREYDGASKHAVAALKPGYTMEVNSILRIINVCMTPSFNTLVGRMMTEIESDIADGTVPASVRSLGDLDAHVDMDRYGGLCDDDTMTALMDEYGAKPEDDIPKALKAMIEQARTEINEWLATGVHDNGLDAEHCTCCNNELEAGQIGICESCAPTSDDQDANSELKALELTAAEREYIVNALRFYREEFRDDGNEDMGARLVDMMHSED